MRKRSAGNSMASMMPSLLARRVHVPASDDDHSVEPWQQLLDDAAVGSLPRQQDGLTSNVVLRCCGHVSDR
ncbi:hypothetical protein ACX80H_06330 [Arthrobacter sp. MDT2-2]